MTEALSEALSDVVSDADGNAEGAAVASDGPATDFLPNTDSDATAIDRGERPCDLVPMNSLSHMSE